MAVRNALAIWEINHEAHQQPSYSKGIMVLWTDMLTMFNIMQYIEKIPDVRRHPGKHPFLIYNYDLDIVYSNGSTEQIRTHNYYTDILINPYFFL